jgi:hypothetical protein
VYCYGIDRWKEREKKITKPLTSFQIHKFIYC